MLHQHVHSTYQLFHREVEQAKAPEVRVQLMQTFGHAVNNTKNVEHPVILLVKEIVSDLKIAGLIAMAYSDKDKPSPPPLILDLVPAHTQTEFNKKSGGARIDASNTDVAELMMAHILKLCSYAFLKGGITSTSSKRSFTS